MTIFYPESLSNYRIGSFKEKPNPAYIRDPASKGAARRRKTQSRTLRVFSFDVLIRDGQDETLRDFLYIETDGGAELFDWKHPKTLKYITCGFLNLPELPENFDNVYTVKIELEEV